MSAPVNPVPSQGSQSQVIVGGIPLDLVDGTYQVGEAPRFGEKISTGTLRYADFNPFESAHATSTLYGGYGLRRYDDVANPDDPGIQTCYDQTTNVDCFPGDTLVRFPSTLKRAYRRTYSGEIISIETSKGYKLSATPNHPILTTKGWVKAGSIEDGDYVICDPLVESMDLSGAYVDNSYTPIQEIYRLAEISGSLHRVASVEQDFHGDGQDTNIDIVNVVGFLNGRTKPSIREPLSHYQLSLADPSPSSLEGPSLIHSPSLRVASRPQSRMHRLRRPNSIFASHGGVPSQVVLSNSSNRNSSFRKHPSDDRLVNSKSPGYGKFCLSSDVASDKIVSITRRQYSGHVYNLETESGQYAANGIIVHNCRFGVPRLSPRWDVQPTGLNGNVVWLGEFTPAVGAYAGQTQFIAVGGTQVARLVLGLGVNWELTTISLPAVARKGAVGVFNGTLTIGFGADAHAVWSNDLGSTQDIKTLDNLPIYVWAFTADRAASYAAGGSSLDFKNRIIASTNGFSDYDEGNSIICASSEGEITSLAPGGGLGLVYVGRDRELGVVDNNGIYRTLIPFDGSFPSNCQPMRWALSGVGEGEQRGSVRIFFGREHSLWSYAPSSDSAGRAENVSVWAKQGFRPGIKGTVTAIQGTARWLFYVVRDRVGECWLLARDANTGATHPIRWMDEITSDAMGVTSLFGQHLSGIHQIMYIAMNQDTFRLVLPLDGEDPLDDATTTYEPSGTLTLPDIDLGFPDESKIALFIRVVGTAEERDFPDGLQPGKHSIGVEISFDGGDYVNIGTISDSNSPELEIPGTPSFKRAKVRFTLSTRDPDTTPQLLGFSLRVSLNAKLYRIWQFTAVMPARAFPTGAQALYNPQDAINFFWMARKRGTPILYADRWGFEYTVRILKFGEQEIAEEGMRTPEARLTFQLLEVVGPSAGPYSLAWGDPRTIWGGPIPNSTWGL